jgi:hypothetical protein
MDIYNTLSNDISFFSEIYKNLGDIFIADERNSIKKSTDYAINGLEKLLNILEDKNNEFWTNSNNDKYLVCLRCIHLFFEFQKILLEIDNNTFLSVNDRLKFIKYGERLLLIKTKLLLKTDPEFAKCFSNNNFKN